MDAHERFARRIEIDGVNRTGRIAGAASDAPAFLHHHAAALGVGQHLGPAAADGDARLLVGVRAAGIGRRGDGGDGTARDLLELHIIDEIVPEVHGGAHVDPARQAELIGDVLERQLDEFASAEGATLIAARYDRFRRLRAMPYFFIRL